MDKKSRLKNKKAREISYPGFVKTNMFKVIVPKLLPAAGRKFVNERQI